MEGYLLECAQKLYDPRTISDYSTACRTNATSKKTQFIRQLDKLLKQLSPSRLDEEPTAEQIVIFNAWLRAYTKSLTGGFRERAAVPNLQKKLRALNIHHNYTEAKHNDLSESENELYNAWVNKIESQSSPAELRRFNWNTMKERQHFAGYLEDMYWGSGTRVLEACGQMPLDRAAQFVCPSGTRGKPKADGDPTYINAPRFELLQMTNFPYSEAELIAAVETRNHMFAQFMRIHHLIPQRVPITCTHYHMLAALIEIEPHHAAKLSAEELQRRFEAYNIQELCKKLGIRVSNQYSPHKLFQVLEAELTHQNADAKANVLRIKLPGKFVGLTRFEQLALRSEWYADVMESILHGWNETNGQCANSDVRDQASKTNIAHCVNFIERYVRENHGESMTQETSPLRWFLENATQDILNAAANAFLNEGNGNHKAERVKNAAESHSVQRPCVIFTRFCKHGLANLVSPDVLSSLNIKKLMRQIDNVREPADPMKRRTYLAEEIEAMFASCKNDTKITLLLRLLSEVGLRVSALRCLKYQDLIDEHGNPRHICRVIEKGKVRRNFVTSDRAKDDIRARVLHVCAKAPALNRNIHQMFVFSDARPLKPVASWTVEEWLRKIAKAAGVTGLTVHPHAFRHTIVSRLMDAGNSLEVVSKFMGHKSLDTTSSAYWVANVQDLHDTLNNPITGAYQEADRNEELKNTEIEVLRKKKSKAMDIINSMLTALDEARAENADPQTTINKIKEAIPNMGQILRIIGDDEA